MKCFHQWIKFNEPKYAQDYEFAKAWSARVLSVRCLLVYLVAVCQSVLHNKWIYYCYYYYLRVFSRFAYFKTFQSRVFIDNFIYWRLIYAQFSRKFLSVWDEFPVGSLVVNKILYLVNVFLISRSYWSAAICLKTWRPGSINLTQKGLQSTKFPSFVWKFSESNNKTTPFFSILWPSVISLCPRLFLSIIQSNILLLGLPLAASTCILLSSTVLSNKISAQCVADPVCPFSIVLTVKTPKWLWYKSRLDSKYNLNYTQNKRRLLVVDLCKDFIFLQ